MATIWQLYRFDYEEYLQLKPVLSRANSTEDLLEIAETQNLIAIANALEDNEIEIEEARQAFVLARCCLGEATIFDRSFLRLITKLRRDLDTEDVADLLGEALAGGKNFEWWLGSPGELLSFLTPNETLRLQKSFPAENDHKNRNRRSGGPFQPATRLLRRLFDLPPSFAEMMASLTDLVCYAAARQEGIVFISERD